MKEMLTLLLLGLTGYVAASPFSSPVDTLNLFGARAGSINSGCSTTGTASCHNATAASNLCCFESPGVRLCLVDVAMI